MSKELTTSSKDLTEASDQAAWGETDTSARNILIPKVLLMQSLSEAVAEKDIAKVGDLLYSLDDTIIGGVDKNVDFIPFHSQDIWIVKHDDKFHHIEPVTSQNEHMKWEELVNGVKVQNVYCINVYALLADDPTIPVIIPFKSTAGLKAGKKVCTQMNFLNKSAGLIPPAKVMSLIPGKTKNDKGTFATLDVKVSRSSTKEEIGNAFTWYQAVNAGTTVADDSDVASPDINGSAQQQVISNIGGLCPLIF